MPITPRHSITTSPPASARRLPLACGVILYYQTHVNHSQGPKAARDSRGYQSEFLLFLTVPPSLFILTQTDEARVPPHISWKDASNLLSTPNSQLPRALQLLSRERLDGQTVVPEESFVRPFGWPGQPSHPFGIGGIDRCHFHSCWPPVDTHNTILSTSQGDNHL